MAPKQPAARSKSPTNKNAQPAKTSENAAPSADHAAVRAPAKKVPAKPKPLGKKMRDGYWQGNVKMFKASGKGVYAYNNGDTYEGTMVDGKRQTDAKGNNRKAKYTWANGAKYQ